MVRTSHVMSLSFWLSLTSVNAPLLRFTRPHFSVRPAPNLLLASEPGDALPRVAPSPTILSLFDGITDRGIAAQPQGAVPAKASKPLPEYLEVHSLTRVAPNPRARLLMLVQFANDCYDMPQYQRRRTGLGCHSQHTGQAISCAGPGQDRRVLTRRQLARPHTPAILGGSFTQSRYGLPFQRLDIIICLYRSSPALRGRYQTMVPGCSRSPTGWVPPRAVP